MKRLLPFVFAACAWGQTDEVYRYLQLSDAQARAIEKNNSDYYARYYEVEEEVALVRGEIDAEVARDVLDPMELGTRYVRMETACRKLDDQAAGTQTANVALLSDAQKAKLKSLRDAQALAATIDAGRSAGLLGEITLAPSRFTGSGDNWFTLMPSSNGPFSGFCATRRPSSFVPPDPPTMVGVAEFLPMSDAQVQSVLKNNEAYNAQAASATQRRIMVLQPEIVVEQRREALNPLALGVRFAEIETSCRDLTAKAVETQRANVALLSGAQKTRLQTLQDAINLQYTISAAQWDRLLAADAGQANLSRTLSPLPGCYPLLVVPTSAERVGAFR